MSTHRVDAHVLLVPGVESIEDEGVHLGAHIVGVALCCAQLYTYKKQLRLSKLVGLHAMHEWLYSTGKSHKKYKRNE